MSLVDSSTTAPSSSTPGQGADAGPGAVPDPAREAKALREVAFCAPFDVGLTVRLGALSTAGADAWANGWTVGERDADSLTWRVHGAGGATRGRGRTLKFDVDDYRGSAAVPLSLATLRLTRESLADASAAERRLWDRLGGALPDGLALRSLSAELSPYGVVDVQVRCVPTSLDATDPRLVREACESASSSLAGALADVCGALAADIARHVAGSDLVTAPASAPGSAALPSSAAQTGSAALPGAPLWVHRVLSVDGGVCGASDEWMNTLVLGEQSRPVHAAGRRFDAAFLPGVGNSVVCSRDPEALDALVNVVCLGNAVWAATDRRSRQMLEVLAEIASTRATARLADLRRMVAEIASDDLALAFFRASLHEQTSCLAPVELDVWDKLVAVWRLDRQLDELDRRRADVKSALADAMAEIGSRYTARLNRVVNALAALGGLSAVIGALDYAFAGPLGSPGAARVLLLAGGTLLLGVALRAVWVGRPAWLRRSR